MAGAKNHDYHILAPDPWPIIGAFSALTMAAGAIMWMHGGHVGQPNGGGWVFLIGLAAVLYTMLSWWTNVVREAKAGDHTPVVQLHLRYGMILFIASEVMFFVGWFWAFFDFSLFPSTLTDTFGTQYATTNYGFLYMAQGVGSVLGGPVAAYIREATGNWTTVFVIVIVLDVITALLALVVLKAMRKRWVMQSAAAPVATARAR